MLLHLNINTCHTLQLTGNTYNNKICYNVHNHNHNQKQYYLPHVRFLRLCTTSFTTRSQSIALSTSSPAASARSAIFLVISLRNARISSSPLSLRVDVNDDTDDFVESGGDWGGRGNTNWLFRIEVGMVTGRKSEGTSGNGTSAEPETTSKASCISVIC